MFVVEWGPVCACNAVHKSDGVVPNHIVLSLYSISYAIGALLPFDICAKVLCERH